MSWPNEPPSGGSFIFARQRKWSERYRLEVTSVRFSEPPTKSQIDKAARRLKRWWIEAAASDPIDAEAAHAQLDSPEMLRALATLIWYRRQHEYPLRKATVGLRSFVSRESPNVVVAQRLKRLPTIVGKLARHPSMAVSRMEDIGGCRTILDTPAEVNAVVRRIRRNWEIVRLRDYR